MAKKNADGTSKPRVRFTRHGDRFKVWRTTSASAAANASEVPQAELTRVALDKVIVEVDKVLIDQGAFQASKQLSSQRLKTLVNQGNKLNTVLTTIIKEHYGNGSDKLVEFGIQPLRTRTKAKVEPPPAPAPNSGTSGPVPATTAPLDSQ
jgi:hypothetical protein